VANEDIIEEIELPSELQIFRDLNVIPTTNPGGGVVEQFISFVLSSSEANDAMQDAGWFRDWN
jgi:accessory colonization factor AcfC